jgi:flagellar biosynthetic protein FliQ
MTQQYVMDIASQSIFTAIKVGSPALLAIMITGIVISIFQAASQINEQTLSFIPKVIVMTAVLLLSGPFVLKTMIFFTQQMFQKIPLVMK